MKANTPDEGVVTAHLRHLRVRNLRKSSISNRRYVLRRLAKWAGTPILYLTTRQLEDWQTGRADQVTPATLRMEMSSVREFYRWCIHEGLRPDNPASDLDMPRVHRGLPRPMMEVDLAHAIGDADVRVGAVLGLAAFAGLRACEIARLDWAELNMAAREPQLRIVDGKGGHGRMIPLSSALALLLKALPTRHGAVITQPGGRAGHCKPHRVSQLANVYLHSIGIEETLHQCRHRFATITYRECLDIRTVQELMGHQSPTTTSIYAQASPDVARRAVEAAGTLDPGHPTAA